MRVRIVLEVEVSRDDFDDEAQLEKYVTTELERDGMIDVQSIDAAESAQQ